PTEAEAENQKHRPSREARRNRYAAASDAPPVSRGGKSKEAVVPISDRLCTAFPGKLHRNLNRSPLVNCSSTAHRLLINCSSSAHPLLIKCSSTAH
ncbi:MAG: hypothetical protein IJL52_09795, partial [Clostridia bacterium]|nr:hypothetical protein [Clostridia bacterium]